MTQVAPAFFIHRVGSQNKSYETQGYPTAPFRSVLIRLGGCVVVPEVYAVILP